VLLGFSSTYELSGIYALINWLAAASLIGGLGLGLGFANGLLSAFLTKRFFSSPHSSSLYRLTLGFAATVFSAALIVPILNLFSSTWVLVPGLLLAVLVLDVAMGAASQAIASWYLRERQRSLALAMPQSSLATIQAGSPIDDLAPLSGGQLAPMTTERIFWNAIWRFSTVGASVGAVLFSTYAKFSLSYATDVRSLVLTMAVAAIMGGSLGLGLGFFNGILSGLLTKRAALNHSRLHRLKLGMLCVLSSASLVGGVSLLLSASWIPVPLFMVILSLSMGATSQRFIRWYLREMRKSKQ
jgi:hypothetical protein